MTRAGMVAVVGKPNAGKSTLLNRLVGQKLAITSPKPQSTRDRVVGIHTTATAQLVLLDTPGLLEPKYALQTAMRETAIEALRDADVVLYLSDATEGAPVPLDEAAGLSHSVRAPVLLILTKDDLLTEERRAELRERHPDAVLLSSVEGAGIDTLMQRVEALLPESPFLYPEDEISTQSVRFFTAELVRETALEQLGDEVPYAVACEIEEFREDKSPIYIRATLHVERESQKRIIIGSKGARIREIGSVARVKIEQFIDAPVYLDLWVKVLPNWRKSADALRRFGYSAPPRSKKRR